MEHYYHVIWMEFDGVVISTIMILAQYINKQDQFWFDGILLNLGFIQFYFIYFKIKVSMGKITVLLLLLACVFVASARRVHMQTNASDPNMTYYEALMQKQIELKAKLAAINSSIAYLHQTLQQLEGLPEQQMVVLEDGLADQRQFIEDLASNHTLPLSVKSVECKNISEEDLTNIKISIEQIKSDLAELETEINNLQATPGSETIVQNLNVQKLWAESYLREMENQLVYSPCPPVVEEVVGNFTPIQNITDHVNLTNIEADNWIYGNMTESEYLEKLFKFITENNVTKCPLETPFVLAGETNCSECPQENPLFDLSKEECVNCPQNSSYNATLKKCVAEIVCEGDKVYDEENKFCVCPQNTPFFDGQHCISCYLPKYWNVNTSSCDSCEDGSIFDINNGSCKACPPQTPLAIGIKCQACNSTSYYDVNSFSCIPCPDTQIYSYALKICTCPESKPLLNDLKCEACPILTIFNASTNKCESCQSGFYFNQVNNTCQICPESAPIAVGTICIPCPPNSFYNQTTKKCSLCPQGQIVNTGAKRCQCPDQYPYYTGVSCVKCDSYNQWWNAENSTCEMCPLGQVYKNGTCQCSSDQYHYNGDTCIVCPSPSFWNLNASSCQICNFGQYLDPASQSCKKCPASFPISRDGQCFACPTGHFYDYLNNVCITCSGDKVFNAVIGKCVAPECDIKGAVYNQSLGVCLCPSSLPHNDSIQCYTCEYPTTWNETENRCVECDDGYVMNKSTLLCQKCPKSQPLEINGVCISCPTGYHYNSTNNICFTCPANSNYIQANNSCVTFVENKCILYAIFNNKTQKCQCPTDKPYNNSKECLACEAPRYWNATSQVCSTCEDQTVFNNNTKLCEACPATAPIESNGICIECPEGTYFSAADNLCIKCAQGSTYNASLDSCVLPEVPSDNNTSSYVCHPSQIYNETTKKCECPASLPYFTINGCINCYAPSYWNQTSNKCQMCQGQTVFNLATKTCEKCPESKPIINNGVCLSCPTNTHYSATSKVCIQCPDGATFNITTSECVISDKISNNFTCRADQIYDQNIQACVCPAQTPYDTGSSCISCDRPYYWNSTEKICLECPDGQIYNQGKKICQNCPINAPFENQGVCYGCPLNSYYNEAQKICIECVSGSYYNADTKKCTQIPSETPKCPIGATFNEAGQICQCPADKPFNNGVECISCVFPLYWNEAQKSCQDCSDGLFYNSLRKQCQRCPNSYPLQFNGVCYPCPQNSQFNELNRVCVSCVQGSTLNTTTGVCQITTPSQFCPDGTIYNAELHACSCPDYAPFSDGKQCHSCYLPQFWDSRTLTCLSCPLGQHFNTTVGQCVTCPSGFVFDPTRYICYQNTNCSIQGQVFNSTLNKCQCPSDYPYLNDRLKECSQCSLPRYWDYSRSACLSCPSNQYFDTSYDQCVSCPVGSNLNPLTLQCITCHSGQHWDIKTSKCATCPVGYTYIAENNTCQVISCTGGQYYDFTTKSCICPQGKPQWNGVQCVTCDSTKFWSAYYKLCIQCPQNTHYNSTDGSCSSCPAGTIYSLNTFSCVAITCQPNQHFSPYLSRCISCPSTNFWNQDTQMCLSCPSNTLYNQQTGSCEVTHSQCSGGQVYDQSTEKCVCTADYPYWNGVQCIYCDQGMKWDPLARYCIKECLNGKILNANTQTCECPPNRPYWSGQSCVSCHSGDFWDASTLECIRCAQGFSYNYVTGKCWDKTPVIPPTTCTDGKIYNSQTQRCECPTEYPFWTGSNCERCQTGSFWNSQSNSCIECPDGYHYNSTLNKCLTCPQGYIFDPSFKCVSSQASHYQCPSGTYFDHNINKCTICLSGYKLNTGTNLCELTSQNTCPKQQIYNQLSKKCQCPYGYTTLLNQESCLKCPANFEFNQKSSKCVYVACPKGQVYNPQTYLCSCPSGFYWNSNSNSCIACPVGYNFDQQQNKCIQVISNTCQGGKYYDQSSKQCICPANSPYWNGNVCFSCPAGSHYNGANKCLVCPAQTPNWTGQKCIGCSANTIWNAETQQCLGCSSGTFYSTTKKACISCPQGYKYDTNKQMCLREQVLPVNNVCPTETPFFNGQYCVTCYLPKYWNKDQKTCESCPVDMNYDITQNKCIACENGKFDLSKYKCIVEEKPVQNQTNVTPGSCPSTAPFWDGSKCVTCYLPKYWNHDDNQCENCPTNTNYDVSLKKCTACENGKFDFSTYRCVANSHTTDPIIVTPIPNNNQTNVNPGSCPSTAPFWDGSKCVSCYLPKYWNHDDNQCENCPSGTNYDVSLKKCTACENGKFDFSTYKCVANSNSHSTDPIIVTPIPSNNQTNVTPGSCPSTAPFWDGSKCVSCYLPKYWNHDDNQCENCPTGTNYDVLQKVCTACENGKFDFSTYRCVANSNSHSTDPIIVTPIPSNPVPSNPVPETNVNPGTCPSTAPFWDGSKCVSCYLPKYWNHDNNQCEYCPTGTNYDVSLKKCTACETNQYFDTNTSRCVQKQ